MWQYIIIYNPKIFARIARAREISNQNFILAHTSHTLSWKTICAAPEFWLNSARLRLWRNRLHSGACVTTCHNKDQQLHSSCFIDLYWTLQCHEGSINGSIKRFHGSTKKKAAQFLLRTTSPALPFKFSVSWPSDLDPMNYNDTYTLHIQYIYIIYMHNYAHIYTVHIYIIIYIL